MSALNAVTVCKVDIYPYEGGNYSLTFPGTGLLSAQVEHGIGGGGEFSLELAPGGPFGLNGRPSWTDILTPMSLVVIGMQRGPYQRIVMIGFIDSVTEAKPPLGDEGRRTIVVKGSDFGKFFAAYSFYNLMTLTGLGEGALGGLGGLPAELSLAYRSGAPDVIAKAFYTSVMAGTKGILSKTKFAYRGGNVSFSDLMSVWFEAYPASVIIPQSSNLFGDIDSWIGKFRGLLPWPFYETFAGTADVGYYPNAAAPAAPVTMDGFPQASPVFVARVQPLPVLGNSGASGAVNFNMDSTRWIVAKTFQLDNFGPIQYSLTFDDTEVFNLYTLMPSWAATLFGAQNGSQNPWIYTYASWVDIASIHRYGYRPKVTVLQWFADPQGTAAQQNANNLAGFDALCSALALRTAGYYEATPLMAKGTVECPLRPDIMSGEKFVFAPYKDQVPWTFYIESVSHSFRFGSGARTMLTLSRGLPSSVYSDPNMLTQIHSGNAMRQNGQYMQGLPAPAQSDGALQVFNIKAQQAAIGKIAAIFTTPQGK